MDLIHVFLNCFGIANMIGIFPKREGMKPFELTE